MINSTGVSPVEQVPKPGVPGGSGYGEVVEGGVPLVI